MSAHSPLRTIIVDDEDLARSVVREHLTPHSDVSILAECTNGLEAVKAISELKPDLVFLDIQMPKLDGFEVLELLDHTPAIIFVTAYDQYALKAFDVHAIDYLLKPFSKERFEAALGQARERIGKHGGTVASLVAEVRAMNKPLDRVLLKEGSTVLVLPADSIDYIEAQDDYAAFRSKGKFHLKHQRLGELEELMDPARFVRIHRSYILNLDRLARIEPFGKDSKVAVLKDGTQLPVSKTGYEKLKRFLK